MTIEMKVPAGSDKKTYEEPSTIYEQKKAANVFKTDFGYSELNEEWEGGKHRKLADYDEVGNEINRKDPEHAGKVAKYRTYHNSEYDVIGMHRLGDDGKVAKGGTPYHYEAPFNPHVRGKNVDDSKESAVNEVEHTIRHMASFRKMPKTNNEGTDFDGSDALTESKRVLHTTAPNSKGQVAQIFKHKDGYAAHYRNADGSLMLGTSRATPYHARGSDIDSLAKSASADLAYIAADHKIKVSEEVELNEGTSIKYAGKGQGNGEGSSPEALVLHAVPGQDKTRLSHWTGKHLNHISTHPDEISAKGALLAHHIKTGIPVDRDLKGLLPNSIKHNPKGNGKDNSSSEPDLHLSSVPGMNKHSVWHWDGKQSNHISTHSDLNSARGALLTHHIKTGIPVDRDTLTEDTAAARTIKGKKPVDSDAPKNYSAPTGLTGPLAAMFGVNSAPPPAVGKRHNNDQTKPETQEQGKVYTPDDLALKLHSSLPGMTRKAISLNHILLALKSGIKAGDIQRMSHSAVGRRHIRSVGGSPYSFTNQVSEMVDSWTIELVQEGSAHKFVVRDEEDVIAEGVNLSAEAALRSAARAIEELGASIEEQATALSEEKEYEDARPSRIMSVVRSLVTK